MGTTTKISWCDHTINFWIGCAKVSPACDGCYAEAYAARFGRVEWGKPGAGAGTRSRTSQHTRNDPYRWHRRALREGTRPFVFASSLSDIFDNHVPPEWRREAFDTMRDTPALVYLLLTKRPQLIVQLTEEAGGLPPNAALGATAEDQERADRNIPVLLSAAAALKPMFTFLSCEPLLGPIKWRYGWDKLGWVITGGETDQGAHKARPMHPDWDRALRDECALAGIPFHRKQWGEWVPVSEVEGPGEHYSFPDGVTMRRVGKERSGRSLDGREHLKRPAVPALEYEMAGA